MGNMSYVRMRNTVRDLNDCYENMAEPVSSEEFQARAKLIALCQRIADEFGSTEFDPADDTEE